MENNKLTIAFFVIGSAIKFNKNKIQRSDGTSEYLAVIKLLLRNPNVKNVLLLSKSDWSKINDKEKLEIDPFQKIMDI